MAPLTDKTLEATEMFLNLSQTQWQESGGQGFKPRSHCRMGKKLEEEARHPPGRGSRATPHR